MNNDKNRLGTGIAAVAAGPVMAMILLYAMIGNSFTMGNASFYVICVIAFFLPMCAGIGANYQLNVGMVQAVMIFLSLFICMGYAYFVTYKTGGAKDILMNQVMILHAAAAAGMAVHAVIRKFRR